MAAIMYFVETIDFVPKVCCDIAFKSTTLFSLHAWSEYLVVCCLASLVCGPETIK